MEDGYRYPLTELNATSLPFPLPTPLHWILLSYYKVLPRGFSQIYDFNARQCRQYYQNTEEFERPYIIFVSFQTRHSINELRISFIILNYLRKYISNYYWKLNVHHLFIYCILMWIRCSLRILMHARTNSHVPQTIPNKTLRHYLNYTLFNFS